MKKLPYIALLAFLPLFTMAGEKEGKAEAPVALKTIQGKVIDSYGEALPGARIKVKETGEEFFANFQGHFNLSLPSDKQLHLVVETIGFAPIEMSTANLSNFSELALKEL